jgi:hypothetical protein
VSVFPDHLTHPDAGAYGQLSHKFYLDFLRSSSPQIRVLDFLAARIDLRNSTVHLDSALAAVFEDLSVLPAMVAFLVEVQNARATQQLAVFVQVRTFPHARLFEPNPRTTSVDNVERALRRAFKAAESSFLAGLPFLSAARCSPQAFVELERTVFTGLDSVLKPDVCAALLAWFPVVAASNPGFTWDEVASFTVAHLQDLAPRLHDLARHMAKAKQESA